MVHKKVQVILLVLSFLTLSTQANSFGKPAQWQRFEQQQEENGKDSTTFSIGNYHVECDYAKCEKFSGLMMTTIPLFSLLLQGLDADDYITKDAIRYPYIAALLANIGFNFKLARKENYYRCMHMLPALLSSGALAAAGFSDEHLDIPEGTSQLLGAGAIMTSALKNLYDMCPIRIKKDVSPSRKYKYQEYRTQNT